MLLMMAQVQAFQLSLLGSPRLERGGQAIAVERRKALALLAYLALTGECQRRETLAAMFWPEAPGPEGRAALRRTLSVLNNALDGGLDAQRDCVGLLPHQVALDVERFRGHVAAARSHHAPGERLCAACLAGLAEAAALCRGDFMDGFTLRDSPAFDDWQLQQTETLRRELAECLELLAMGYALQGDYRLALEPARRWVALDPLHEPAQRLLMKLYAWSGQPAAAVRVYQECVRVLEAELGLAPQPETRRLDEAIRAGQVSPPVNPRAPSSTRLPDSPETVPSRPPRPSGPPQLPAPTTPLLGRAEELMQIAVRLGNPACRLVTIAGPAGSGKTRLALKAAANYGARKNLPVYFVSLAATPDPGLLAAAICDAIGLTFAEQPDGASQLIDSLRGQSLLLVLDNLEHLLGGAGLLADILAQAPGVKVLATSRERLHLHGEWLIELGGLPYPASPAAPNVEFYDAVQLFVHAAQRARADFALDADTRAAVVEICRLVEGMPLGLELAAPWVRMLPVSEIAAEITRNVDFLATTRRDVPERHRSMRAAFEHSWQLLDEAERRTLRRLSVFRGPFLRAAAAQIAGADLPDLAALVDKSLLRALPPRHRLAQYELHDLVLQFGAEKLQAEPTEAAEVRRRHSRYYMQLLARQIGYVDCSDWSDPVYEEFAAEIDNIRAAWQVSLTRGDLDSLEQSHEGLCRFYKWQGWYQEGADALDALAQHMDRLAARGDTEAAIRARARRLAAVARGQQAGFCHHMGQIDRPRQLFREAVDSLREQGASAELAHLLVHSGELVREAGDLAEARRMLAEGLALSRSLGNQPQTSTALRLLGYLEGEAGAFDSATEHLEEAVALGRSSGDQPSLAGALSCYGFVRYLQGQLDSALEMLRESLAIEETSGQKGSVTVVLDNLGYAYAAAGEVATARAHFARAVRLARELSKAPIVLDILLGWSATLAQPGEAEQAAALITFVAEHPATWLETKDRAARWLAERGRALTPAALEAAQCRGRALGYDEAVLMALGAE